MEAIDFYGKHAGETCLIVSNGPNLVHTPPEWFDYPSFGINRLFKYPDWKPDYYVGVDQPLWIDYRDEIVKAYDGIPKFMPSTYAHSYDVPDKVIFKHFASSGHYIGGWLPTNREALTTRGITYQRILGAVFQIAAYMGFATMLVIGIQHKPGDDAHFWDDGDEKYAFNGDESINIWFDEYKHWAHFSQDVKVLNISEDTFVPDDIIPRDDWRRWATDYKSPTFILCQ